MSESFFSRWSRRKQQASDQTTTEPSPSRASAAGPGLADAADAPGRPVAAAQDAAPASDQPLPTLEDVRSLTPQSDFQPFMQRGVGSEVRNAAMKKLFADPHFNVMDGLDIYIDDYSQPDPLPAGMLQRMASAQFMKLVPEPATEGQPLENTGLAAPSGPAAGHPQDPAEAGGPEVRTEVVAQSPLSSPNAAVSAPHHDHPDLQLQPDRAPADPDPGSRPG